MAFRLTDQEQYAIRSYVDEHRDQFQNVSTRDGIKKLRDNLPENLLRPGTLAKMSKESYRNIVVDFGITIARSNGNGKAPSKLREDVEILKDRLDKLAHTTRELVAKVYRLEHNRP